MSNNSKHGIRFFTLMRDTLHKTGLSEAAKLQTTQPLICVDRALFNEISLNKALSTLIRCENGAVLLRFKKRFASTLIVFVSFSPVHTTTPYPFENAFIPSVRMLK